MNLADKKALPPHVFALATLAYQQMVTGNASQVRVYSELRGCSNLVFFLCLDRCA